MSYEGWENKKLWAQEPGKCCESCWEECDGDCTCHLDKEEIAAIKADKAYNAEIGK